MQTDVVPVDAGRPQPAVIERAAAVLRGGGLVAFPTETVYGLGANALDAAAVARIFEAKGRPANNPLIVHVVDDSDLTRVVAVWPEIAQRLARQFWPGPLTLILPRGPEIPDIVTALPSPGMLGRHYAPRTPLECLSESQERVRELLDQGEKVGWVTFDPRTAGSVTFDRRGVTGTLDLLMPRNPAGYAAHLYEV